MTADTSRFIQPVTQAMRARVSYRALGPVFTYPWFGRIDKAWWTFPGRTYSAVAGQTRWAMANADTAQPFLPRRFSTLASLRI
ncbi:MAG: hypothetical protein ACR2HJ_04595 [Fimbriimonadales bacterium]